MKHHHKFLIGAKLSLSLVSNRLNKIRDDFVTHFNYNSELKLYVMSFTEEWEYTEEKHCSGEVITDKRRLYLHFYYNDQKANDDKVQFIALQLMSYIKKQMDENGLFSDYTMQSLLDELDVIEYY